MRVRIKEAAFITGRSENTIREAVRLGKLSAIEGRWMGGVKGKPGVTRWIDVEALASWHMHHGGAPLDMSRLPTASLDRLAAEVTALEERLKRLEGHPPKYSEPLESSVPLVPTLPPVTVRAHRVPVESIYSHLPELPDGWVVLVHFATAHGARETQMTTFRSSQYLGIGKGQYRLTTVDRNGRAMTIHVRAALDPAGQQRFHELWRGSSWWQPSPACALCERPIQSEPDPLA